jgi:glycerol-3-phosphate dehydrogenase (NAD(P)+)
MNQRKELAIVGSGAFGSALSNVLSDSQSLDTIWILGPKKELETNPFGENTQKSEWNLKEFPPISKTIRWIVLALPSNALRDVIQQIKHHEDLPSWTFVLVSKGMERGTHLMPFQILEELLPNQPYVLLSGPNFARELQEKRLSASTLASRNPDTAVQFQRIFQTTCLKTQITTDVTGVSLAGVFKNIIAVASGASDALNLGHNARAALITLGVQEMCLVSRAMGAKVETFFEFSGIGDLILTAIGDLSRNRQLGRALVEDPVHPDQFAQSHTCEGFLAIQAAYNLSLKLKIKTKLVHALHDILLQKGPIQKILQNVLESI